MKIQKEIYKRTFDSFDYEVRFSDLPTDLQSDDVISIEREKGFYLENQSCEPYTQLIITREMEETEEEAIKRREQEEREKALYKEQRFKNYQELKAEFEA